MKAKISKSVGNSYLITVDGVFRNLVTWKMACRLMDIENILPRLNKYLGNGHQEVIEIKEPKVKEEPKGYDVIINWIDKRRTVKNIIDTFGIDSKLIKIEAFKYSKPNGKNGGGYSERENPTMHYYLECDRNLVPVHKDVFYNESGAVFIEEKRAL